MKKLGLKLWIQNKLNLQEDMWCTLLDKIMEVHVVNLKLIYNIVLKTKRLQIILLKSVEQVQIKN